MFPQMNLDVASASCPPRWGRSLASSRPRKKLIAHLPLPRECPIARWTRLCALGRRNRAAIRKASGAELSREVKRRKLEIVLPGGFRAGSVEETCDDQRAEFSTKRLLRRCRLGRGVLRLRLHRLGAVPVTLAVL
jgi:hypothetical protein